MDKQTALQILSLTEGSSEKQIKDKYRNFLKLQKSGAQINIKEITVAYNFLLGFDNFDKLDESSRSYRVRRFLFHYLSYILIFMGFITLAVVLILPKLTEVKPDLSISFVGSFYQLDEKELKKYLYDNMEGLETLSVDIIYLNKNASDGEYDVAGRVKLSGKTISREADIFIEDDENFVYLLSNEVLMPLDDIIPLLEVTIDESKFIYARDPSDGDIKIYGIDVSLNKRLMTTVYGGIIRIFSIAKETEHFDNAIKAGNLILKEGE